MSFENVVLSFSNLIITSRILLNMYKHNPLLIKGASSYFMNVEAMNVHSAYLFIYIKVNYSMKLTLTYY